MTHPSSPESDITLDRTPNHVVMHTAGRAFPGILVQGDALGTMAAEAKRVRDLLHRLAPHAPERDAADALLDMVETRRSHYERVLRANGFEQMPW